MSILSKLRIPYSSDLVYGFILLTILLVPTSIAPQFTETAFLFTDPLESVKLVVWSILVGVAMIAIARRVRVKTMLPNAMVWLLSLLLGYIVVTLPFSFDVVNSLFGVTLRMNSSLWFFLVFVCWIGLLSSVEANQFKILIKTTIVTGAIVTIWGIVQSYGLGYYGGIGVAVRQLIPSFLGNPNFTAMFITGLVPLTVWLMYTEQSRVWRLLYIFFGVSFAWGLVLFTSRAALLGALVALIISIVLGAINKQWKFALLLFCSALAVLVVGLFYFQIIRPEVNAGDFNDQSTTERYYVWNHAFEFIKSRPLTGSGLGNYFIAYRQNARPELAGTGWFDDPHNLMLYMAASGGVPVALLFILIIGLAMWHAFKKSVLDRSALEPGIWMAAILAWLITSSFGPVTLPSWLVLGFLLVGTYRALGAPSREVTHRAVFVGAGAIGVVLIFVGVAFTASEVLAWQSQIQLGKAHKEQSLTLARLAVVANPTNTAAMESLVVKTRINGQYEETGHVLERLERLHSRSSAVLQFIFQEYIILWNATQDPKYKIKAYETMENYSKTNANYFITYRDRAIGYMALGDYDKAVESAQIAAVMANKNYQMWVLLAQAHKLHGDREAMLGAFRQAVILHPSGIVVRVLHQAEQEPDINKITLPYSLPILEN